jgi:dihydrofolate synthase/folylpolyglutamate synthase
VITACDAKTLQRVGAMRLRLQGLHQLDNAAVAVHVVEELQPAGFPVSEGSIHQGLSNVEWPGRLEWRELPDGRHALLDAAHNRDGAAALAAYLHRHGAPLPLVFGAMRDKDIDGILRELVPAVSAIICTRASNPRAATADELAQLVRANAPHLRVESCDSPAVALERAWRLSPRIVIAGSIFLLGDVIQIAWPPTQD